MQKGLRNLKPKLGKKLKNNTNAITKIKSSKTRRIIAAVVLGENMNEYFIEYCVQRMQNDRQ